MQPAADQNTLGTIAIMAFFIFLFFCFHFLGKWNSRREIKINEKLRRDARSIILKEFDEHLNKN